MTKQIRAEITDEAYSALEQAKTERGVYPGRLISEAILHLVKPQVAAETESKIDALLQQFVALRSDLMPVWEALQNMLQEKQTPVVPVATPVQQYGPIPEPQHPAAEEPPPAFHEPQRSGLIGRLFYKA